jgi:hypothetical protein
MSEGSTGLGMTMLLVEDHRTYDSDDGVQRHVVQYRLASGQAIGRRS